jgi:hypothetical protein
MIQILDFIKNDHTWTMLGTTAAVEPIEVDQAELGNQAGCILHESSKLQDVASVNKIGEETLPAFGILFAKRILVDERPQLANDC